MGGKLGDFLHAMFAVKNICKNENKKANVYMYDIGWELGIQTTYAELLPIMKTQEYINSFNILENYEIDLVQTPENNTPVRVKDDKLLKEGFIDLGHYIRSPWLYKVCWSELYSKTFNFPIKDEYAWIKYDKVNNDLIDKVLIHRRHNPIRINHNFPYEKIIDQYKDRLLFVSFSNEDYENFKYKEMIPFLKMNTLQDLFSSINSCSMIISNLSSPAVMANALDKLRIIELPNIIDAIHSIGEEKYSKNFYWYIDDKHSNL